MRFGLTTVLLILGTQGIAQECVLIENDLDRLACYDEKSGRTAKSEPFAPAVGHWSVDTQTSEFKDTTDVFMRLSSSEPVRCRSYGTPGPITLFVRCMENTTAVYFAGDCHLTSNHGGYGRVEYRIDDLAAKSKGFDASTDNQALGLWRGSKAIPFAKEMLSHEKLLIRFTPFSESAVTARFDITGFDEAIKPLRKACGW